MSELTLLIPAKKEAESLPIFLDELKKYHFKILIVLEEKDQETINAIIPRDNLEIFYQKTSGYGSALIEGINHIKTKYFCIINADGSMNPNELDSMFKIVNENNDLVFASRYLENAGSEDDDLITTVGNYIFSFLGKLMFNLKLNDILYTYVIGNTELIKKLNLTFRDFKICVELPIKAHRSQLKYTSTPSFERKRIAGKKKVKPFIDGLHILIGMFYLFFNKIL
ncbi:glycosyltransferase family 2 protein [Pelagibacterales bacterium SAG-MED39]|nr:glycosyltransferase family 2 protein [Pelagibacterales bacterium SAG-MED39]